MTRVCEVLTADPPGANARIKFERFQELYLYYVTQVEKTTSPRYAEEVCTYLKKEWV